MPSCTCCLLKTFHTQFVIPSTSEKYCNTFPVQPFKKPYFATLVNNDRLFQETSENGGWVSTSELTVRVHPNDRNKMISCYAVNQELGETIQKSHMVSILCKSFFLLLFSVQKSGKQSWVNKIRKRITNSG